MKIRILIALSAVFFVGGCDKPHVTESKGVQITGGGFVQLSTPDQVQVALDQAIDLVNASEGRKNIMVQFWEDWGKPNKKSAIHNPKHLFPNLALAQKGGHAAAFKSPGLEALKHNRTVRKESGDCISGRIHNDASVSELSPNAEICFSIGNLTRIPPSGLLREVLGLVIHEAVHMGGAEESEATEWQTQFTDYFGARFGDTNIDTVSAQTLGLLGKARILISDSNTRAGIDKADPQININIGKLQVNLANLPHLFDPLALELETKPTSPQLMNNYSNSVLALIQNIQDRFGKKPRKLDHKTWTPIAAVTTSAMLIPILSDYSKRLDQIEENYLALLGGPNEAKSVCVLPTRDIDPTIFDQTWPREIAIPARTCD